VGTLFQENRVVGGKNVVDFAQHQRNPGRHVVGFGIVLALHLLMGWALITGLAQRLVEVIKAPIETKIIEETKPPPPPRPRTCRRRRNSRHRRRASCRRPK
jgi:hypothetical protein